eukprot:134645_1
MDNEELDFEEAEELDDISWRKVFFNELQKRNLLQRDIFRDTFAAYNILLKTHKGSKTRILELEKEVLTLRQDPTLLINATSPRGSDESALQGKVRALQDELISAYRLRKENDETIDRLKERSLSDEKLMMQKTDELVACKKRMEETIRERQLDVNELESCKETVEVLQKEVVTLRSQLSVSENKLGEMTRENRMLIERIKSIKQQQVEEMNEFTEQLVTGERRSLLRSVDEKKVDFSISLEDSESSSIIPSFNASVPSQVMLRYAAHKDQASSVAFNRNGSCLVSGGADTVVKQWRTDSPKLMNDFRGATQAIMSVSVSTDSSMVLAAGNDRTARIWSVRTCRVLSTLTGHENKIYACCFNLDSSRVISGSFDRTLRIWDVSSGYTKKVIMCISSCNNIALSPDGQIVASAHLDGHVRLWSVDSGEAIQDISGIHKQQTTSVSYAPSGCSPLMATNSKDSRIQLIDVRTYEVVNTLSHPNYKNTINWGRAVFSPDGRYLAAGGHKGALFVWSVNDGKLQCELPGHRSAITCCDWSSAKNVLATCDKSGEIVLWQ